MFDAFQLVLTAALPKDPPMKMRVFLKLTKVYRLLALRYFVLDRRIWFKISVSALVIFLLWYIFASKTKEAKQCFQQTTISHDPEGENTIKYFPDLLKSSRQPTPGKTIFFHETSCSGDGIVRLNAR